MEIKRTIIELFPGNAMPKLVLGIEKAIAQSLETHPLQNVTQAAVKHRFEMCIKWAEILRGDLGWGTERISNSLIDMLNKELSGAKWEPGAREFWIPTDGV